VSAVRQPLVALEVVEPVKSLTEIVARSTWAQLAPRAKEQKVVMVPPQLGLLPVAVVHQQRAQTTTASIPVPVAMDKKLASLELQ
jgi:hypothetical protein